MVLAGQTSRGTNRDVTAQAKKSIFERLTFPRISVFDRLNSEDLQANVREQTNHQSFVAQIGDPSVVDAFPQGIQDHA
ncbi:hypothetical protein ACP70R_004163 [Stipagrostis hirtigluma subsp. patula]